PLEDDMDTEGELAQSMFLPQLAAPRLWTLITRPRRIKSLEAWTKFLNTTTLHVDGAPTLNSPTQAIASSTGTIEQPHQPDADDTRRQKLERLRLPKATRVKARQINQLSLASRRRARRLKRKKKKKKRRKLDELENFKLEETDKLDELADQAEAGRHHLAIISSPSNSLLSAVNIRDLARISTLRREAHEPFRIIESKSRLVHLRKAQEFKKS
ncbi:hypothetical protein BGZ65_000143, partial [Modicella reniformis]